MALTAFELIGKLTVDGVDKAVKSFDTLDNKLQQFSTRAKQIGNSLSTFVTLPLTALGVASVKAASDLEESLNAVGVVFEDASGSINRFGESAAENVGLAQSEFNGLATVLGAQLKQSGQDIDTVADQTIELTERAADLASVFNTDVKDAAGALGAALRGESEPARRFAINISDAAVQAEALASGLVNTKDEITDQIKVQARYQLILQQSADVAGDFKNTSDGLANSSRILKAQLQDLAADIGANLLPFVTDLVAGAAEIVQGFVDLDDGTKTLIVTMGGLLAAIGPIAKLLAFATSPVGWVTLAVGGVAALAVAISEATSEQRQYKDLLIETEEIQNTAIGTLEDITTATQNNISAVEGLTKSWIENGRVQLTNNIRQLRSEYLPLQTELTLAVSRFREANIDLLQDATYEDIVEKFLLLNPAFTNAAERVKFLSTEINDQEKLLLALDAGFEKANVELEDYERKQRSAATATTGTGATLTDLQPVAEKTAEKLSFINTEVGKTDLLPIDGLTTSYTNLNDDISLLTDNISTLSAEFTEQGNAIDVGEESVNRLIFSDNALTGVLSDLDFGVKNTKIDMALLAIATKETSEAIEEQIDLVGELSELFNEIPSILGGVVGALEDLITKLEQTFVNALLPYAQEATGAIKGISAAWVENGVTVEAVQIQILNAISSILDALTKELLISALIAFARGNIGGGILKSVLAVSAAIGSGVAAGKSADIQNQLSEEQSNQTSSDLNTALSNASSGIAEEQEVKYVILNQINVNEEPILEIVSEGNTNGKIRQAATA